MTSPENRVVGSPENSGVAERGRLDSLTPLRFFAALLVFVSHLYFYVWYRTGDFDRDAFPALVMRMSLAGVSFFFLLSGFVLTWSARHGDTAPAFWRRRLVKIFPNHAVTWVVALVLLIGAGEQISALQGASTFFLFDAWIPDQKLQAGVNPVSWSLGCEAFFYFCFPFLHRVISTFRAGALWLAAALCTTAITVLPIAAVRLTSSEPLWGGLHITFLQNWLTYTFPAVRIFEFLLGIILARIVITGARYPSRFRYALVTIPVGYLLALQVDYPYGISTLLTLPLALLVLATAHADISGRRIFLRRPSWIWLGNISFAFYMVHLIVIQRLHHEFDPGLTAGAGAKALYSAAFLVISLLLSWWLFAFVEAPLVRHWGRSRRTVLTQESTETVIA